MELTKPQLSYLASLIREDLADGVMAWDTPEGTSLTREDIRDLCKALEPEKKEDLGLMPIQLALGLTTVIMAVSHIVPLREFYEGVDWPVVVLLGAMIPLGGALESTGTTELLVAGLLVLVGELSPVLILAAILVLTMTISDVLNNAATAILMAPIAYNIATSLDFSPDAFLMAVAVGASCAFLTPVGHQNNALIMGPGGYRFGDYWRMGLPLELLIVFVAIPLLLLVWPL